MYEKLLLRLKRTCNKNNYEKKEITPLTKKEEKKHNKREVCHIYKKDLVPTIATINTIRLEIIVTILENIEVLLMMSAT